MNISDRAIMKEGANNFANSLAYLRSLPLKNTRTGNVNFDPTTYAQFRTWLLEETAAPLLVPPKIKTRPSAKTVAV